MLGGEAVGQEADRSPRLFMQTLMPDVHRVGYHNKKRISQAEIEVLENAEVFVQAGLHARQQYRCNPHLLRQVLDLEPVVVMLDPNLVEVFHQELQTYELRQGSGNTQE